MRVLYFCICLAAALLLPWWAALVPAAFYALRYSAYELLAIGMVVDATYGVPVSWMPLPVLYTLGTALLLLAAELLKPRMAFYDPKE